MGKNVKDIKVGDKVGVGCISDSCMTCHECNQVRHNKCWLLQSVPRFFLVSLYIKNLQETFKPKKDLKCYEDRKMMYTQWSLEHKWFYSLKVLAYFRSTLQRKSHLCIPILGIVWLSPNFYIHVSVNDIYIPRISPHISCSRIGRSMVEIYKSLTDTWMWKLGLWPPNSCLGIFFSNICYWFLQCEELVDFSIYDTLISCLTGAIP